MRLPSALVTAFLLTVVACGETTDASGLTAPLGGASGASGATSNVPVCAPGKQEACACPGGTLGVQLCRADGTGYESCACGAGGNGGSLGKGGAAGVGGSPSNGGTGGSEPMGGGAGGTPANPNDVDGDGWTVAAGDCNDGDALVNPGAFEVFGNQKDDDCNGATDEAPVPCDTALTAAPGSAADAAKALGLCQQGAPAAGALGPERIPGVIKASYSDINGAFGQTPPKGAANPALQLGTLPSFGPNVLPREGGALLALSSGVARATGQESAPANTCSGTPTFATSNAYPPGFPKMGTCGTTGTPNDGIAIDVQLRAPVNAKSFKIRFKFLTCEFPNYVCQIYNDVFAILMSPSPLLPGDPMADGKNASANVAFETSASGAKNVIGVNNTSFLTACKVAAEAKYTACAGEEALAGTGFEGHASSSWLETHVPIPAFPEGEDRIISLRFAIWDSGDQALDSTALVDGFEWQAEEASGATTVIAP